MTEIYLIRHGEAEGNVFRRIHGQYESLLTKNGFAQVRALEKRFRDIHIDACYASDLTRTSLTAGAVYLPKGLPLHRDPAFREVNLGVWEDLPFGYLYTFQPESMRQFNHDSLHWSVKGSETFGEYTGRFIRRLRELAEQYAGGTIAIFCHGSVLRGALACLFYTPEEIDSVPYCDNTAVSHILYEHGNFTPVFLNNPDHLDEKISTMAKQRWWRKSGGQDFNLWFRPAEGGEAFLQAAGAKVDACLEKAAGERDGFVLAMLQQEPVGYVSLDTGKGRLEKMYLEPKRRGLRMEDQLLGHGVSFLRARGFREVLAAENCAEDSDVLDRYGFTARDGDRVLDIDTKKFDWSKRPEMAL